VSILNETREPIYTSRIKASALIADIKVLLSEWDLTRPVDENLVRVQQQNILASRPASVSKHLAHFPAALLRRA
jgi:hypothetical protein